MNEKARYYGMQILAALLTFGLFYLMKDEGITKYIVVLAVSGVFFFYGIRNFDKDFLIDPDKPDEIYADITITKG